MWQLALGQLTNLAALSPSTAALVWILATGFWNDSGVWDDSAVWID